MLLNGAIFLSFLKAQNWLNAWVNCFLRVIVESSFTEINGLKSGQDDLSSNGFVCVLIEHVEMHDYKTVRTKSGYKSSNTSSNSNNNTSNIKWNIFKHWFWKTSPSSRCVRQNLGSFLLAICFCWSVHCAAVIVVVVLGSEKRVVRVCNDEIGVYIWKRFARPKKCRNH